MRWDIGMEISETETRVAAVDKGVILRCPSAVATRSGAMLAMGDEALLMLGRTPKDISVTWPFSCGRPRDMALCRLWIGDVLSHFTSAAKIRKPNVILPASAFLTRDDRAALTACIMEADGGKAGYVSSDMAAALGAGWDVLKPEGVVVAQAGAGMMSAALLSAGRVVAQEGVPFGMSRADENLARILRKTHALAIGPRTAEEIKRQLASAAPDRETLAEAVGIDMKTGFPYAREIAARTVYPAVAPVVDALVAAIINVARKADTELSADLLENGVILTGGGARLFGLDKLVTEHTNLPCRVAEDACGCVIRGIDTLIREERYSILAE